MISRVLSRLWMGVFQEAWTGFPGASEGPFPKSGIGAGSYGIKWLVPVEK